MMRELLERRAAELQGEYEHGAAMLQQMDRDRETLTQTLLRISGALQLAGEMLLTFVADETRATGVAEEETDGSNH